MPEGGPLRCLDPSGDMRHASSFTNQAGFAEGSVEYSQALKAHVASELAREKKEKVAASKEAVADILAAEYPGHIQLSLVLGDC